MAAKKFGRLINAIWTEVFGTQTSAGAANAGDIVALDDNGRLDNSLMPVGIGADTKSIQASEALAAGDYVNVHDVGGAWRVRKADATSAGKKADGFVLAAVSSGANATVYFEGTNNMVSGMTPGDVWLSATTPGAGTVTPPSGSAQIIQKLGISTSATEVSFEAGAVSQLAT